MENVIEDSYYHSYEDLGAHPCEGGYCFAVWAPNAKAVSVVGEFNNWQTDKNPMDKIDKKSGIYRTIVKGVKNGDMYKFAITTKKGKLLYKADPYAFYAEVRPNTASKTYDLEGYKWNDSGFLKKKKPPYNSPMLIYEMHLGSWQKNDDGSFLNYRELADRLCEYIVKTGYTHVEIMPVSEHPYDGSWGYQCTGYFAATSRYGEPKDFMYFVDKLHQSGIYVIMDWVPAHFPRDEHGLRLFDGTPIYEYKNPQMGEHKEWGTLVFDYSSSYVRSFLISNALFWFRKFHIDGLRVDAVSSMLYLDYNRQKGEWISNKDGTNHNYDAIDFLRRLNSAVFSEFPNALMVAEESTTWPLVTKPVDIGGLGFNFKWNMGWMNDTLRYFSKDPLFRKGMHSTLTFSMMYAFSENYILPLSHDEVVHGKCSLIEKMPGAYEDKFAGLRLLYGYLMAHPGKKLLFMGAEFGQFIEWNYEKGLDTLLFDYDAHKELFLYVCDLNGFYKNTKALWQIDDSWDGFNWINAKDASRSIISFERIGLKKGDKVLVVCNFTPVYYPSYKIGVSKNGYYKEIFSSDDKKYGGRDVKNGIIKSSAIHCDGMDNSIDIKVPPFSTVFFKKVSNKKEGKV